VEALEAPPESCDSLWKNRDQSAALDLSGNYLAGASHLGALAALDVQRATSVLNQPTIGQLRISDLAMKVAGNLASTTKMSTQEM